MSCLTTKATRWLAKPIYAHRPDQVVRRLLAPRGAETVAMARLPWGARLEVNPQESIGSGIARTGVHELAVTEVMWRLAGRDELALDVGANIGYFTSLLSQRCREVWAFEPHPDISARLLRNTARMRAVEVRRVAVSDASGRAYLALPSEFDENEGVAFLSATGVEVETVALDDLLAEREVGILKIDVEGHELAALNGAQAALGGGRVRDIFFEDHAEWPSPVGTLLQSHGYRIFGLRERFRGVDLCEPEESKVLWAAPTFLATLDPQRAERLMAPSGWRSLRPRKPVE